MKNASNNNAVNAKNIIIIVTSWCHSTSRVEECSLWWLECWGRPKLDIVVKTDPVFKLIREILRDLILEEWRGKD